MSVGRNLSRHKSLTLKLTSPMMLGHKLCPPFPPGPPPCPLSLFILSNLPSGTIIMSMLVCVCILWSWGAFRGEAMSSRTGGGGEEKALDERWEEELSYEEKGNQRRSGGGGRDTRTTLTIYGYAPMANGNYICFNYWCPNRLSLESSPLGIELPDRFYCCCLRMIWRHM